MDAAADSVTVKNGQAPATAPARSGRKPFLILGAIILVVVAGVVGWSALMAGTESTDDAQIAADLVPVGTRVAGLVTHVFITENQRVKKGDPLVQLDDADYIARVAQAEAELAIADAQLTSSQSQITAAQAQSTRADTDARKANTDVRRTAELRAANATTQERLDNAQSAHDSASAAVNQAQAQVSAARAQVQLAQARKQGAQAALDLARLQLSYTKLVAPDDGVASRLAVHEGQMVQVGQPVIQLVPVKTYVVANFKETQVGKMVAGQKVHVHVDAFPGQSFAGTVDTISGGTGSVFSLLPADNATGNFVKVVQRVPVRVAWTDPPPNVELRAGMSAEASVEVGR